MSRRGRSRFVKVLAAMFGVLGGMSGNARANAGGAQAPELPLSLEWSAPATCPTGPQVHARIREHLGREGIEPDPTAGRAMVRASIDKTSDGHRLVLEIETPAGATRVEADDETCEALAELVAIKVSLALDPVETARQLLPKDDPEPVTPTPSPQSQPPPSRSPTPKTPALAFHLQLAPSVGGGALPSVELGGMVGLGASGRMWQITLGLQSASGPGQRVEQPPGARVGFVLLVGTITGCVVPTAGPVAFPACVGFDAGAIQGRGIDLAIDRAAWSPLLAPAIETGLAWPRRANIRLLIRARARVHALRPSFAVGGLGEVHRSDIVGGLVLTGMEAVFPLRKR